jgi:hypothetical protein
MRVSAANKIAACFKRLISDVLLKTKAKKLRRVSPAKPLAGLREGSDLTPSETLRTMACLYDCIVPRL